MSDEKTSVIIEVFARDVQRGLSNDGLLVGFDPQKDHHILNAAYNDRAGFTARFNLNVLTRRMRRTVSSR